MKKILLLISYIIVFAAGVYVYVFLNEKDYWGVISYQAYLLPVLLAVLGGVYAVAKYGKNNPTGRALLYFSLGIASLFIGELIWFYYEMILEIDPFPSIADIPFIISYPLMIVGIMKEINISKINEKVSIKKYFWIPLGIITVIASVYFIYSAFDYQASALENIVSIGYALGDIVLVIMSIIIFSIMRNYEGGKIAKPWFVIGLGMVFMLIADVLFSLFNTPYEEQLIPYVYIDLVWILSYLLLSYGLFSIGFIINDIRNKLLKTHN